MKIYKIDSNGNLSHKDPGKDGAVWTHRIFDDHRQLELSCSRCGKVFLKQFLPNDRNMTNESFKADIKCCGGWITIGSELNITKIIEIDER